jgi:hypothetical protein
MNLTACAGEVHDTVWLPDDVPGTLTTGGAGVGSGISTVIALMAE